MDYVLVEKFLSELAAPEARQSIHNVLEAIKKDSGRQALEGLQYVNRYIKKADAEGYAACVNGILFGLSLSMASYRSPQFIQMIQAYLEDKSKLKGENVIDFHQKQAEIRART